MTTDKPSDSEARELPQNVEVAITRMRALADSALESVYERECQAQMRNAIVLLKDAYASPAPQGGERETDCPSPAVSDDQIAYAKELATERREAWSVSAATDDVQSGWNAPTVAQINSACLSFRHDFGLLDEADRQRLKNEACWWLDAWRKEGFGSDRNEVIERCAAVVDQANREGPYQAIAAASRIRALKSPALTDKRPPMQEDGK